MNRELGADFDLAGFRHDARWNPEREWMELGWSAAGPDLLVASWA